MHNRKPVRLPDNCSQKFFCIRQKSVVYCIGIILYKYLFTQKGYRYMGLFTKVFGTYSQRELKSIYPIVDKITALEED